MRPTIKQIQTSLPRKHHLLNHNILWTFKWRVLLRTCHHEAIILVFTWYIPNFSTKYQIISAQGWVPMHIPLKRLNLRATIWSSKFSKATPPNRFGVQILFHYTQLIPRFVCFFQRVYLSELAKWSSDFFVQATMAKNRKSLESS